MSCGMPGLGIYLLIYSRFTESYWKETKTQQILENLAEKFPIEIEENEPPAPEDVQFWFEETRRQGLRSPSLTTITNEDFQLQLNVSEFVWYENISYREGNLKFLDIGKVISILHSRIYIY